MLGVTIPRAGGTAGQPQDFGSSSQAELCWGPWASTGGVCGSFGGLGGSSGAVARQGACPGAARDVPRLDGSHHIQAGIAAGQVSSHPAQTSGLSAACLTNAISWVFLVLFFNRCHHSVAFPCLSSLLCRSPLPWIPNAPHRPARPCSHSFGSRGILPRWLPCPTYL